MNKRVKKMWTRALRSDEFKQGRNRLRTILDSHGKDKSAHCCLGVLCELYRRYTGKGRWLRTDAEANRFDFHCKDGDSSGTVLPVAVQQWAGLDSNPKIGETLASTLNDVHGNNFEEIARKIEVSL